MRRLVRSRTVPVGDGRSARRWIVAFLTVMVAASGCEVVHHDAAEALPKFTSPDSSWG